LHAKKAKRGVGADQERDVSQQGGKEGEMAMQRNFQSFSSRREEGYPAGRELEGEVWLQRRGKFNVEI